jgi:uncharacterized protein YqgC (DUF456 family)
LHLGSSTQLLVVLSKWGKNLWVCEGCHTSSIPFITLKMVFVPAWTTGDASDLSGQSWYQVHFVYSMISIDIVTQSKFNSVIRCGTTKKGPWSGLLGILVSCLCYL